MPDPAPVRQTDEEYVAWVRNKQCLVCDRPGSDPAHLDTRGSGGSDYTCIPLCRIHHREQEDNSLRDFEDAYHINLYEEALRLLRHYIDDRTIYR